MDTKKKVAMVSCSNGLQEKDRANLETVKDHLRELGLEPVEGKFVFAEEGSVCREAGERAKELMDFYTDPEIEIIFDVSGGDVANEILKELNFGIIEKSGKWFYGYSDLTTIINAIYARTGRPSVLYQIRNLAGEDGENQRSRMREMLWEGTEEFFTFPCEYLQGEETEGVLVGGNIRCLLKLAGTPYWPDMKDKILLLESYGGTVAQMKTYLAQLEQMGVFEQIRGILLGTFTKMEAERCSPDMASMVLEKVGSRIPVIRTDRIGHGADSSAVVIGSYTCLQNVKKEHRPMHN